jgi:peptidoglycan-associated lipoprotein
MVIIMKSLQLFSLLLIAVMLTACSPRVAQPPPLEELEPPADEGFVPSGGDIGPSIDSMSGTGADGWGTFEGNQPITTRGTGEWRKDGSLETIYFDYDAFALGDQARRTLLENAEYLKQNPGLRVLIEGHCDERGTEGYNQALGENRALAVREYLVQLGISPSRIDVLSYGELMPAVEGSAESAYRWNRRAEFKVAG